MGHDADGVVIRVIAVHGAAAKVIVVAGLKAVGGGHLQRLIQHLAAGRAKGGVDHVRRIAADAGDAANRRNILDKFLAMGFGPLGHVGAECFPIHVHSSFP